MEQEKELWGHKFRLVNGGLDEAEVYSFVQSLIDQYGNLASKLERLDAIANRLGAQYSQLSRRIDGANASHGSEETPPTDGFAVPPEFDKLRNLDAPTSFAEKTVVEAAGHARAIETEATERAQAAANRIVANALQEASSQAAWLLSQSPPEAPPAGVHTVTHGIAPLPADHASPGNTPLHSGNDTPPAPHDLRQDAQRLMDDISTTPASSSDDVQTPDPSDTSPASDTPQESSAADAPDQPRGSQRPSRNSNGNLFDGTVELALPPPVALDRLLQLHRHLKETPHVDVLNLGGSVDNGITIRVLLDEPIPLLNVLEGLSHPDEVVEELPNDDQSIPRRQGDKADKVRRVVISARE